MDQQLIIQSLFKTKGNEYSFHDAIFEALDISYTQSELKRVFSILPSHVQSIAFEWGLSDTVFCDEAYTYCVKHSTIVEKAVEAKDATTINH